jgi:molecular chaperone GrpE
MNEDLTQDCPGPGDVDPVRARILHRFEVWLDEVLAQESQADGVAQEILDQLRTEQDCPSELQKQTDLFTLFSGFTALSEETRLQGRSFKALAESMGPMQGLAESVSRSLEQYEQTLNRQERQSQEASRREGLARVLDVLLDVRDRLVRGRDSAQAGLDHYPQPVAGWAAWRVKPWAGLRDSAAALVQGTDLALTRLDEALRQWGVRPIDCLGRPFDAQTMAAVDLAAVPGAEDGTVLEVYRTGYWWDEQVYRIAEVKVVRNQSGK